MADARVNIWFKESELQVLLTALRCYLTLAPEFDRAEKSKMIQKLYNDVKKSEAGLKEYKLKRLTEIEKEHNGPPNCPTC